MLLHTEEDFGWSIEVNQISNGGNDLHESMDNLVAISYNALSGSLAPRRLQFKGHIGNSEVTILVDSGSRHNFVQQRLVKHLNLLMLPLPRFQVMIGNGSKWMCDEQCVNVKLIVQGFKICETFYVLTIQGVGIMLEFNGYKP